MLFFFFIIVLQFIWYPFKFLIFLYLFIWFIELGFCLAWYREKALCRILYCVLDSLSEVQFWIFNYWLMFWWLVIDFKLSFYFSSVLIDCENTINFFVCLPWCLEVDCNIHYTWIIIPNTIFSCCEFDKILYIYQLAVCLPWFTISSFLTIRLSL